ncbi:hypothetical protein QR680_009129 [Steinernema hermaphroditum]|uniref:Uncharacterized protein n=1 Tax=Steinernema hermaphroditum TaxID=289476 RepID=A0AA39M8B2_9BILA|nr:hypothetical protein QR680_009129 [Steinernema hermaphroditum]
MPYGLQNQMNNTFMSSTTQSSTVFGSHELFHSSLTAVFGLFFVRSIDGAPSDAFPKIRKLTSSRRCPLICAIGKRRACDRRAHFSEPRRPDLALPDQFPSTLPPLQSFLRSPLTPLENRCLRVHRVIRVGSGRALP